MMFGAVSIVNPVAEKHIAVIQLFENDTDTIGLHLKNIYESGELQEVATTEESSVVQQEGKRQVRRKKAFEGKLLSEAEIEQYKQETDYEPASVLIKKIAK